MSAPEAHGSEVTIYDVARAAGVSPSTVSRAFTRPGRVSAHTTDRIRQVAAELGYRGRGEGPLRARSTARVLGLWVTDITAVEDARVARGCLAAAEEAGFVVLLHTTRDCDEPEPVRLRRALPLLDGAVVASSPLDDAGILALARELPVVLLDRHLPGVVCLVPDVAEGARLAVEHLSALGHRAVTYLGGPQGGWAEGLRWRAVRAAGRRLGVPGRRLGPFAMTVAGGRGAAEIVAAHRLGAVVCASDLLALGLVRGLQDRGLDVPGDVSVVGFGNVPAAALASPPLTTVAVPLTRLGEAAVRCLVALVEHRHVEGVPLTWPVRLVVRESTGPPTQQPSSPSTPRRTA